MLWSSLGDIGVARAQEAWIRKRVRLTNRFTACMMVIATSYVFVFYSLNEFLLAGITVVAALSFLLVIYLNYRYKYFLSRFVFVLLINNWVLFYCFCLGPDVHMHMIFFGLACCPWLLFDTKNWYYIVICVWVSVAEFLAYILINPEPFLPLSPEFNQPISISFYFVVFLVALLSVGFLSIENGASEIKLERSNDKLKALILEVNEANAKLQKQLDLERRNHDLERVIEQKDRINSQLDRFTYTVAHDLKSPLYGSKGLIELIRLDIENENYQQIDEYAKLMEGALLRLGSMIDSILEYSRNNHLDQQTEEVDVHELVQHIGDLLFLPGNVELRIVGKLPSILTNRVKLLQVFQNLVSNAIKYNDKDEIKVEVGVVPKENCLGFYVKDNGRGIDPNEFNRLFGLFETVDDLDSKVQSGIGLNIIKVLVEEQGGEIHIESELGIGSTFYFDWYV